MKIHYNKAQAGKTEALCGPLIRINGEKTYQIGSWLTRNKALVTCRDCLKILSLLGSAL